MPKTSQIVVKYKKGGKSFEILCHGGTVEPFRNGKCQIDQCLIAEEIFSNASKFQKVKSSDLKKTFGTDDKMECIQMILSEGTFSLTKNELNEKIKQKRGEIINHINKYYHDSTKNPPIPHPVSRIEQALEQMKIKIDPHETTQNQLKLILKRLPDFLRVKPVGDPLLDKEMTRAKLGKMVVDKQKKNKDKRRTKENLKKISKEKC